MRRGPMTLCSPLKDPGADPGPSAMSVRSARSAHASARRNGLSPTRCRCASPVEPAGPSAARPMSACSLSSRTSSVTIPVKPESTVAAFEQDCGNELCPKVAFIREFFVYRERLSRMHGGLATSGSGCDGGRRHVIDIRTASPLPHSPVPPARFGWPPCEPARRPPAPAAPCPDDRHRTAGQGHTRCRVG